MASHSECNVSRQIFLGILKLNLSNSIIEREKNKIKLLDSRLLP